MSLNDYVTLGRSGLRVSELCLGTMTFGEEWGWGAGEEESRRVLDAFLEAASSRASPRTGRRSRGGRDCRTGPGSSQTSHSASVTRPPSTRAPPPPAAPPAPG